MKHLILILLLVVSFGCDSVVSVDPEEVVIVAEDSASIIICYAYMSAKDYSTLFINYTDAVVCSVNVNNIDTINVPEKYLTFSWGYRESTIILGVTPEDGDRYTINGSMLLKD